MNSEVTAQTSSTKMQQLLNVNVYTTHNKHTYNSLKQNSDPDSEHHHPSTLMGPTRAGVDCS